MVGISEERKQRYLDQLNLEPWQRRAFEQMPPWEHRDVTMPWESCEDEVRHLCERWGLENVRRELAKMKTGRPPNKDKEAIWIAVELFRHFHRCNNTVEACDGLAAFIKKRGWSWPTNAGTIRRVHAGVKKIESLQTILGTHIENPIRVLGRDVNFEDSLSFALMDLRC
jgi:hypothetical protein